MQEYFVCESELSIDEQYKQLSSKEIYSRDVSRLAVLSESEVKQLVDDRDRAISTAEAAKVMGDAVGEADAVVSRDEAINKLVNGNLRLVLKLVSKEFMGYGLRFEELVACGNTALMKAMQRFDPKKGKLSGYLIWWMRREITCEVAKYHPSRAMSIGTGKCLAAGRVVSFIRKFELENGRPPTNLEVSESCDVSEDEVDWLIELTNRHRVPLEYADIPAPEVEMVSDRQSVTIARQAFDLLDNIEKTVIRHRYGLDGAEILKLREIGDMFGLTPERIRQIQVQAVKRMSKSYSVFDRKGTRK
jgi:RNA polymerase primary sigma factor